MGQKVNPVGMRVGIIRDWDSKWYAQKEFANYLHEDIKIRKLLESKLAEAAVSRIEILRTKDLVNINIHAARPGVVIGQDGKNMEALNKAVAKITKNKNKIFIIFYT